jgi:membrane protease YdiL (CAAX protease family)
VVAWIGRRPLVSFFVLAYLFSWLCAAPFVLRAQGIASGRLAPHGDVLVAFGPLAAALVVTYAASGQAGLRAFAGRLIDWRMGWAAFSIAVLAPLAAFVAACATSRALTGIWPQWPSEVRAATFGLLAAALAAAASGPGEEPGWRGFALPRLQARHGALAATALLWLAWAPWHLPMFFYRADLDVVQMLAFFAALFAGAIWLTCLYNLSGGNVVACIAWHSVWNIVSVSARAMEPSPFPWMGLLVLIGAAAMVAGFGPTRLAPSRAG